VPLAVHFVSENDTPVDEVDAEGRLIVPYGSKLTPKVVCEKSFTIKSVTVEGMYVEKDDHGDWTFTYRPTRSSRTWDVVVKLYFFDTQKCAKHKLSIGPAECDDELDEKFKRRELEDSIVNAEKTAKNLREYLQRNLEDLEAAQGKLLELKVEQAKLN
jgi:hypothetical protein